MFKREGLTRQTGSLGVCNSLALHRKHLNHSGGPAMASHSHFNPSLLCAVMHACGQEVSPFIVALALCWLSSKGTFQSPHKHLQLCRSMQNAVNEFGKGT